MPKLKAYTPDITQRFLLIKDEVMQELGLSIKKFAESIGEYPQNIAAMEKGDRSPTLDQATAACLLYGYSANWLLLNVGPKKIDKTLQLPLEQRVHELELQVRMIKRIMTHAKEKKTTKNAKAH